MTAYYGQGYFREYKDADRRVVALHKHNRYRSHRDQGYEQRMVKQSRPAYMRPVVLLAVLTVGLLLGLWFDSVTASASSSVQQDSLMDTSVNQWANGQQLSLHQDHTFASRDDQSVLSASQAVTVRAGDSLWSIAKEHAPEHRDIREYIYEMKQLNRLNSSTLHEGMKLLLP